MRLRSVACAVALMATACGSTTDTAPETALEERSVESSPDGSTSEKTGPKSSEGSKKTGPRGSGKDGKARGEPGRGEAAGGRPGAAGDGSGSGGMRVPQPGGDTKRSGRGGGALHPAEGTFVYAQRGFEEFCTASCDRQPLPRKQQVRNYVTSATRDSATVVSEAQASEGRLVRTTLHWTRSRALITRVYLRFAYSGFTFSRTYEPRPAVLSARFPLRGEWQGSWKGRVSGNYRVSVLGPESVRAAGTNIDAIKVYTRTNFRGDFEGTANATVWLDAGTKAIVKTAGNVDVRRSFGRYISGFKTTLVKGPGY